MASEGSRSRWHAIRDTVRTQLWPLPAIAIGLAFIVGVLIPQLDAQIDDNLPPGVSGYLFGGGSDAARAVLETIAGSLITVTSLVFSLTVVTLQLASSQFSPRLLRTFSSDRVVQSTLALFLGTFTYALTVLRTVRTNADDQQMFVPQLAVTFAFALTIASVLSLVLFLAHLAREIRVETMLVTVHRDATGTIKRVLRPPEMTPANGREVPPQPPMNATPLLAGTTGFLVRIDESALLSAAQDAGAVLIIDRPLGAFLVAGTPISTCWSLAGGSMDRDSLNGLQDGVAGALHTGIERTAAADIGFGLRQLTDVAVKALSPGINDPTTAIHALGHSAALLCELVGQDLGPRLRRDEEDTIRVVIRMPGLAELLELAIGQPRRYGAADPEVITRLYQLLDEVAWTATLPDQRQAIAHQLGRLRATTEAQHFDPTELERLARLASDVEHTLARADIDAKAPRS